MTNLRLLRRAWLMLLTLVFSLLPMCRAEAIIFFSDEIDTDFYNVVDLDTNETIFDFWNYAVDSGTFFAHNTSNYAGIEMIQFSIDHIENNEFNKHLPEGFDEILNDAFNNADK